MRVWGSVGVLAVAFAIVVPLGASAATARSMVNAMMVTSAADTVAVDGQCTLREAIENHNAKGQPNVDCPKGKKKDTIEFAGSGTITLTSELPAVQNKLTIQGAGAMTINGADTYRIIETSGAASLTLLGIALTHGSTPDDGGAVLNQAGTLTLNNVPVMNNHADGSGGGVYSPDGSATIVNSTFSGNSANTAGGLGGAHITITGSTFSNNTATQFGGGLYPFDLTMTDSTVTGNHSGSFFGGVGVGGPGTIVNSTIANNTSQQAAGIGVQEDGGVTFVLDRDSIENNHASCAGAGGLATFSTDATAAIFVLNTTISGNSTASAACGLAGGGMANVGPSPVTIANSTIAGNYGASVRGGAIYNSGQLTLLNDTISANYGGGGGTGGIYDDSVSGAGTTTLANTILANNENNGNVECTGGGFTSSGHNIDGDNTCGFNAPGDQTSTNPQLGALANNGGPTLTMAPVPGGPAGDNGSDAVCKARPVADRDQRGIKRPQGPHCDVGSVEVVPT
jgi:CSLREA domain-containing protein